MTIKFEDCSIFDKKEPFFNNGLNFYITKDRGFLKKEYLYFNNKISYNGKIYIEKSEINFKDFAQKTYYVNIKESSFFLKNVKFKRIIKPDSEIAKLLDIQDKVFDLKFRQLWHWSYLCSCARAIKKGKTIIFFPWLDALECSIQAYRFSKLYEYSKQHDLIIIIPTDSIDRMKKNIKESGKNGFILDFEYNVLE